MCHTISTTVSIPLITLNDSRADENFTDSTLVSQTGIPVQTITNPKTVNALDG